MLKKLIILNKEKNRLEEQLNKSMFMRRIEKIMSNIDKEKLFIKIDRTIITIYFKTIIIELPIKYYEAKYNSILKYLKQTNKIFSSVEYKYVTKEEKIKIKELNRKINSLGKITIYNKKEVDNLKIELKNLQIKNNI